LGLEGLKAEIIKLILLIGTWPGETSLRELLGNWLREDVSADCL